MWGRAYEGCGCEACRGAALNFEAAPVTPGAAAEKPVWTLEQIVSYQLRWDARWADEPIDYAFYTQAPPHQAGNGDYSGFVPFTAAQQQATRNVLSGIADIVPLEFVEQPDNQAPIGAANMRLTYATSLSTAQYFTAYAAVQFDPADPVGDMGRIYGAEMMFNGHRWAGDAQLGSRQYYVLIHETLHGLGLPHPGQYNRTANEEITYETHAEFQQDSNQYSVMSYFSERETGAFYNGLFASTPLLHDIAVLQAMYGADMTTRTEDTTYGFNSNAGGPYDLAANPLGSVFCIWDAGGVDTIDLSGFVTPVLVDLNPGAFSSSGVLVWNISVAFGAEIERGRGGGGSDRLIGNGLANVLWGEAGDDFVHGGAGRDELFGGAGADHLIGGADEDRLLGEDGDDLIGGQDGDDFIDGGLGRDTLYGDAGRDHIIGGTEGDGLFGQDGDDLIGGQDGDDFIDGGAGRDTLFGDAGGDHMIGGSENDGLFGQDGNDLIGGQDGNDFLDGGAGADTLYGDAGGDHMIGGAENDGLFGQDGDDLIGGQDGNDFIDGGAGADTLYGDAGGDHMIGGSDGDRLFGQDGDDLIGGQEGNDVIDGGAGRDTLFGDAGDDILIGGGDIDVLVGQGGADRFVFTALADSGPSAGDRVADFDQDGGDRIDLSAIDADLALDGDQAFTLVAAFEPGAAAQARLSFDAPSNCTTLELDADGDGRVDFVLLIQGQADAGGLVL